MFCFLKSVVDLINLNQLPSLASVASMINFIYKIEDNYRPNIIPMNWFARTVSREKAPKSLANKFDSFNSINTGISISISVLIFQIICAMQNLNYNLTEKQKLFKRNVYFNLIRVVFALFYAINLILGYNQQANSHKA
ncbi:hypothetical protein BpHYR1_002064 [Brachionus plicatilis]|uniref:Uncharacterized protein n=1 Tax=Brachionus plicatilis TaxID=10195 RepID=A0A3M7QYS7_BRAPC|nr:hypothetical protein BpHYR1_002064 [Brachionus plicatilis]